MEHLDYNIRPIKIKIPFKAPGVLITKLRKRGNFVKNGQGYCTNQAIKIYGFYFALKAMKPSGKINNFLSHLQEIKYYTCLKSTSTIYQRIEKSKRFGLLKKEGNNLQLCSWQTCLNLLGIKTNSHFELLFVVFENIGLIETQYLIELANEVESQYFIKKAILKNIKKNEELTELLKSSNKDNIDIVEFLFDLQKESFIKDHLPKPMYNLIHSVQACPFKSVKKMVVERTNGNKRATFERLAYLKRKLEKSGIVRVVDNVLVSDGNARPNKTFYYNGYDLNEMKPVWYLPTHIYIDAKVE